MNNNEVSSCTKFARVDKTTSTLLDAELRKIKVTSVVLPKAEPNVWL